MSEWLAECFLLQCSELVCMGIQRKPSFQFFFFLHAFYYLHNTLIEYQYYLAMLASAVGWRFCWDMVVYFPGDSQFINRNGKLTSCVPWGLGQHFKEEKGESKSVWRPFPRQWYHTHPPTVFHRRAVGSGSGCRHYILLMLSFRYNNP